MIGVTGHRWNRIVGSAASKLSEALQRLFTSINEAAPDVRITITTGMAEGADLTAALARPPQWRLEALLPLPPEGWRAHLAKNATGEPGKAVAELDAALSGNGVGLEMLPSVDGRPDYENLGNVLVRRSDLLIAVWDGEPGLPGGTGSVVAHARDLGKPMFRLWPDAEGKWRLQS